MSKILFKNAYVVSCNDELGDLDQADTLVSGSRIVDVGRGLDSADAEVIDAGGMLLMPGMVDTHAHLWETPFKGRASDAWGMEYFTNIHPLASHFAPEDIYAAVYAGAIESLSAGVTAIFDYDSCILSPEHADAAIAALKAAGIRATFGYDLRGKDPGGKAVLRPSEGRFDDIKRLRSAIPNGTEDLLRLAVCLSDVSRDTIERATREIRFSRDIDCPMSWHCNKGGEITLLSKNGLLSSDMLPAHGNYTTDEDLELLGTIGGFLTTQPEAETYAGRRSMSMVGRGHRRGVGIALGIDVPVIMNFGLLPQMRLLYFLQRYMDGICERHEGQFPIARRPGVPTLTPRDLLRFGTTNGTAAIWIGDAVGQIAPGFQADLVLLDTRAFGRAEGDPAGHIVLNSSLGDVHTVMVAGEFRKRDGHMVGVDMSRMLTERQAARDRVYRSAGENPGKLHKTYWAGETTADATSIKGPAPKAIGTN
ncbi:MAG TPA: amidohydrolase family protein [Pseudolabrys sp.]|nr:amidohydrolase family protein [Pseudolabrys sp.]